MSRHSDPFEMMRLSMQASRMMLEAQAVIAMRLFGMAGMWRVTPSENSRMVHEKSTAAMASGLAAGRAVMSGKSPAAVALSALKPVGRKTRSNVARLSKRGPKITG